MLDKKTSTWTSQQSRVYSVLVNNTSKNKYLPFEKPKIVLAYRGKRDTLIGDEEVIFNYLPKNFFEDSINIKIASHGFKSIDTTLFPKDHQIQLNLYRDNTYSEIFGRIEYEGQGIKNALVTVAGKYKSKTDEYGYFEMKLPEESQRIRQSIEVIASNEFEEIKVIESIIKDVEIIIELKKK